MSPHHVSDLGDMVIPTSGGDAAFADSFSSDIDVAMDGHVFAGTVGARMAPPHRQRRDTPFLDLDDEQHWEQYASLDHHLLQMPELEPNLEYVIRFRQRWRHDIVRIRTEVMKEINDLVNDFEESSMRWMADRPPAVRKTDSVRYPFSFTCWRPSTTPTWQGSPSTTGSLCWANYVQVRAGRPGQTGDTHRQGHSRNCVRTFGDTSADARHRHARASTALSGGGDKTGESDRSGSPA